MVLTITKILMDALERQFLCVNALHVSRDLTTHGFMLNVVVADGVRAVGACRIITGVADSFDPHALIAFHANALANELAVAIARGQRVNLPV